MPNWCNNHWRIVGNEEDLNKVMEYVKGGDNQPLTFKSILPMPEELIGTTSPARIVSQEEYDNWTPAYEGQSRPLTQEMSDRYIVSYGHDNWYDWCNSNWDTKWDAGEVRAGRFRQGDDYARDELHYDFETAWGPPTGVFKELARKFPDLHMTIQWNEEGGMSGVLREEVI